MVAVAQLDLNLPARPIDERLAALGLHRRVAAVLPDIGGWGRRER